MTELVTRGQWLSVAVAAAAGSDCSRRCIGAVVVNPQGVPLSMGFIETPPGTSCRGGDCPRGTRTYNQVPAYAPYHDCISTHAEAMAIGRAVDGYGAEAVVGSVVYVTDRPCHGCAIFIASMGMVSDWIGKG